jgi:hypothetical protein
MSSSSSTLSALLPGGMLLLRPRFVLVLLTVLALLLPLLLPEAITPLLAGVAPLARTPLGVALVLAAAGAAAWYAPGGATGAAAALLALALLHGARMAPVLPPASAAPLPLRAALAVAAAGGTIGLLQRYPSARDGYMLMGAAALAHVLGMLFLGARGNGGGVAGFVAGETASSPSATAAADSPPAEVTAPLASGPPVEVTMVAPGNAPAAAPMAGETAAGLGGPEYSGQLEQHMVQLRAPPGKATQIWNAPPYGPALGVGALAAAGSFKGDMSDVVQRLTSAGGIKTV